MRVVISTDSVFYLRKELQSDIEEYKDDYNMVIQERENKRFVFVHQSPQHSYRKFLVDYLRKICIEKELTHCCLHLATYILDVFMDNHQIDPKRLVMVANTSLILAAKFEESIVDIPDLDELILITDKTSVSYYINLEIMILRFFRWDIMIPTAAHYVHYYMQAILSKEDIKSDEKPRNLIFELTHFINKYLDELLDDVHFMQNYSPSRLAAALIAASRLQLGLELWNENLTDFTKYSKDDIQEPLEALLLGRKHFNCITCNSMKINSEKIVFW
ncbi:hypothetical protein HHI36_012126 [Cryptolaemus montrouzieri]|uniref:Uncharacterized protein n=1 Tax=Cryptolaemus montrouzieri TaxID=559131 RepID=A0ABD2NDJ6_9CUCU